MIQKTRSQRSRELFQTFPKVELHRHLEGSLRLETLWDVARSHGITIPNSRELRSLVQVNDEQPYTFQNFLSKFQTLRLFYRSPEIIGRVTREAVEDAAEDNIRYLELRFTPVALSKVEGFPLADVMDWVTEGALSAQEEYGVVTRLIVSVNRNESVQLAEQVAQLAVDRQSKGVVGLDLAGSEANFPALPFVGLFREAQQAGLHLTIHAGEWGGANNVAEAIIAFNADRIGHGVRSMEDSAVIGLARERGIPLEVCITSNYQSGVVPALSDHPVIRMLNAGLNVTLNTDDPSIEAITLGNEYRLICKDLGLPIEMLVDRILAAINAAFLPEAERQVLHTKLKKELGRGGRKSS